MHAIIGFKPQNFTEVLKKYPNFCKLNPVQVRWFENSLKFTLTL